MRLVDPPLDSAFSKHGVEVRILVRCVQAFVSGSEAIDLPKYMIDGARWDELWRIADANRLIIQMLMGLQRSGVDPIPASILSATKRAEKWIAAVNSRVLYTAELILEEFRGIGVEGVIIKGPLRQLQLYGTPFLKPASDLDLLVRARDFDRARNAITGAGFKLAKVYDTFWWRGFLGEQALVHEDPRHATIDLHWRIQQPGCPAPKNIREFFDRTENLRIGAIEVPVVAREHGVLISCMSLAKALVHGEPAGHHLCDIAAFIKTARKEEIKAIQAQASEQGLYNTLLLGLHLATLFFESLPSPIDPERIPDWKVSNAQLLAMVLLPEECAEFRPRGRDWLFRLSDRRADCLRETLRKAASEACRIACYRMAARARTRAQSSKS